MTSLESSNLCSLLFCSTLERVQPISAFQNSLYEGLEICLEIKKKRKERKTKMRVIYSVSIAMFDKMYYIIYQLYNNIDYSKEQVARRIDKAM